MGKYLIIADYFSKFPYVLPVASAHHFKTINHLRDLFTAGGVPAIVMSNNGPPFNGDKFKRFAQEFDFVHTTSFPQFHQNNGFIKAMVKKVKNTYKKTDGSPNAQARALLQLWDTPIMADLPSPVEILHGQPAQGAVLSRPSKQINIWQIHQRLVKIQNTHRRSSLTEHTEQRINECSRWMNEYSSFQKNKGWVNHITWLTGTVTKVLDCGHSYMIQGPNGRVYRRNRTHLNPFAMIVCHFKAI